MDNLVFKRTNIAQAYCDSLAGKGIANAIPWHLFLEQIWQGSII